MSIEQKQTTAPISMSMRTNSTLGILFMIGGMFCFAAADALAKLLNENFHPMQIVWVRQMGLFIGVLVLLSIKGFSLLKTSNLKIQVARGVAAATSATLFVVGIGYVHIADAVAVSFVAPFMVTLLAAFILKEKVGVRRWSAILIGFIGMLIIIRPGMGVMDPALLIIVVAALVFAIRQIISRTLAGGDSVLTTICYTGIVAIVVLTIPMLFVWVWPTNSNQIYMMIGIAILGACGEVFVIKALETAEAVVVAPMQYTILIWGTLYGYLIFDHLPDGWTWVGATIIMTSGLYTVHREHVNSKAKLYK
ncbi:MAG: DMT family transporter [Rhizobiales bacterium]|nr:DMT family transporter [Hyphomicrobiales bacterium]